MTPVAVTSGLSWPRRTEAVLSVLFIAVFPSIDSYLLWNTALRAVPASRAGVFLNLITVFTVTISLAAGQSLSLIQLGGGILVFAGIALVAPRRVRTLPGAPSAPGHLPEPAAERTTRIMAARCGSP